MVNRNKAMVFFFIVRYKRNLGNFIMNKFVLVDDVVVVAVFVVVILHPISKHY